MKRIIVVLAGFCLALGLLTVATASSQASTAVVTSTQTAQGSCFDYPTLPADVSGCRFYTGKTICVDGSGINGAYYRVATIAQAWNIAVGSSNVFALDYSNDCAADGYPPSRRFVVDGYYGDPADCLLLTNQGTTPGPSAFKWWTQGPGVYINFNSVCATAGQTSRDKIVSMAIGYQMGLDFLHSSGWSSRVMYGSGTVSMPDAASAHTLYLIYLNYWGQ